MRLYKILGLVMVGFLFCFLASCRAKRQDVQKTEKTETFKEYKEFFRDTTIYTPKTETSLKLPVSMLTSPQTPNSKPQIYTQRNGNATARIEIRTDTVTVTATCDSLALRAQIKRELTREATARSDVERTESHSGYTLWQVITGFLIGFVLGAVITFIIKTLRIV